MNDVELPNKQSFGFAGALLFRLSKFWRLIGVMHTKEQYVLNGMSVNPHPSDNPALTKKIEVLHQHLLQERRNSLLKQQDVEQQQLENKPARPAQKPKPMPQIRSAPPVAAVTAVPAGPAGPVASAPAPPVPSPSIGKFDESQLQMLLPIPLIPNKRWLMMDLGDDFTHIWMSQWRKFLSLDRIKRAVDRSLYTDKTISLAPSNCQPEVFVTGSRPREIFVGPYNNNEPQKLALFYQTEDRKMILSENYAKLSASKPFTKKTYGMQGVLK